MPLFLTLSIIRYGAIQGRELHPPLHLAVVVFEKEAFESHSIRVAKFNFIFNYYDIHWRYWHKQSNNYDFRIKTKFSFTQRYQAFLCLFENYTIKMSIGFV